VPSPAAVTIGVSLKMYFGHREALRWFQRVAEVARANDAVAAGDVLLFVVPTYLQIPAAVAAFAGTAVQVGVQDVAIEDSGAYTGEVSALEVAEVGVTLAEVGHAERRLLYGENDHITALKVSASLRNGLTPVLCIGESERLNARAAAAAATAQLRASLVGASEGPVIVAYEPVWALGVSEPAPADHIQAVSHALGVEIRAIRPGSIVIYGGSAGPGLLTRLGHSVDGLFLGRFAHDVENLAIVINEAAVRARRRDGCVPRMCESDSSFR
jgi:triosephosphate isomerase